MTQISIGAHQSSWQRLSVAVSQALAEEAERRACLHGCIEEVPREAEADVRQRQAWRLEAPQETLSGPEIMVE